MRGKEIIEPADSRYKFLETFTRATYYLETLYIDPKKVESSNMLKAALQGIISQLDPHTMYISPRLFQQLTAKTKGQFGGIGVTITQEKDRLLILNTIEQGVAQKAGLLAGDAITHIDGHSVEMIGAPDAVDLLRGMPGSNLVLTIERAKEKEPLLFQLTRAVVNTPSVISKELSKGIFYLRLTQFQEGSAEDLDNYLRAIVSAPHLHGLIFDLRDNPGGLLDQAVKVADLFIETGVIVSTVGRQSGKIEREFAHKNHTYSKFPMITLVNGGSASAAEIVAGALQDHRRSLLMGTTTFGKGSVQVIFPLPDGSGLKLTTAEYFTPSNRSIQAKGIEPDVIVTPDKTVVQDKVQKERDLLRHLEERQESQASTLKEEISAWPSEFQVDNQLVYAVTYLNSYRFFSAYTHSVK